MDIDKYESIQILMHPHQWEHHGRTSTDLQFVFPLQSLPLLIGFIDTTMLPLYKVHFRIPSTGMCTVYVFLLCFYSSAELQKEGGSVHYHQRSLMVSSILTCTYEKYHLSIPTQAISNLNHQRAFYWNSVKILTLCKHLLDLEITLLNYFTMISDSNRDEDTLYSACFGKRHREYLWAIDWGHSNI